MKHISLSLSAFWTLLLVLHGGLVHAQERYALDRVYTGNQVSNTVSVVDPSTNQHLGEITLGKPQVNVLTPLYKGQVLVHGLRFEPRQKLLAVVAIGSNSITLVSTEDNKVLKTIYIGRAPHEPTFTPDGKEVWTTVRGEAYLSVVDVEKMAEIKQIPVADGPGMIAFTPDGKFAYVCSSFTPVVDVVDTATYQSIKKIPVISPFSPNIFTSPDGKWVALSHKDVGKVTIIDTATQEVVKVIPTGPITNHVTFCEKDGKLLMPVTVGGENCIKIFDPADDYKQIDVVKVGVLPHGLWASPDGKRLYVGLEYMDAVQPIDLEKMVALPSIKIGKRSRNLITGEGTSRSGAIKNHCETAGTNVGGLPPNKWADTLSCK
ncbi:MAG: beta-propeller fold lactonase family protein, partial [Thermoguttaceae bacterium]